MFELLAFESVEMIGFNKMEELKRNLKLITNPKTLQPGELVQAIQSADEYFLDKRPILNPRLKHFLQNRSYQKALLWIEGNEATEKGVCGG